MESFNEKIVLIGIPIIASIITTLIIKPIADKYLYDFKLESDYKAEQRRKIKDVLSKHKVHLLKSCESLNHRLWNFLNNHPKNWHDVNGDFSNVDKYYIQSFVYRILSVIAWVQIIEKDLIFLDTTISKKEDLMLIKYFRLIEQTFCDLKLYEGKTVLPYNTTDHFLRNQFEEMSKSIIRDKEVISFTVFQKEIDKILPKVEPMFRFIEGMNPVENRLRWHRLQILHLVIIAILNNYGYDFQYTDSQKIKELNNKVQNYVLLSNFREIMKRSKMSNDKELNHIIKNIKNNLQSNL